MTTTTQTLAEFLLARYDEVEEVARAVQEVEPKSAAPVFTSLHSPTGTVEMSPARVLADVEAKRRIVALHAPSDEHLIFSKPGPSGPTCAVCVAFHADIDCEHQRYPCDTLRYLALPFADHPDYGPDWRP